MAQNKGRKPSPSELEQATIFRDLTEAASADPALAEAFGPTGQLPVQFAIIPQKNWMHCPPISCNAGAAFYWLMVPQDYDKPSLPLIVPGVIETRAALKQRLIENVQRIHICAVDFDRGDADLDALEARAAALGLAAVIYRTPSDGADVTPVLRCKGLPGEGAELCAPTVDAVTAHLIEKGYRADLLGVIEIVDPAYIERATGWQKSEIVRTKILVKHRPLAKSRFVTVLAEPFERRQHETGAAFNTRWGNQVLRPLAHQLGCVADPSCFDTARGFYVPSSRLPTDDVCRFLPGAPLDITTLPPAPAPVVTVRRKVAYVSGAPSGRYRLADLFLEKMPGLVRSKKQDGNFVCCECPFDETHGNCGDPSDVAFWATNSGKCGCMHSHGAEHSEADYVRKMVADGWVTETDLEAYRIPPTNLSYLADRYKRLAEERAAQ